MWQRLLESEGFGAKLVLYVMGAAFALIGVYALITGASDALNAALDVASILGGLMVTLTTRYQPNVARYLICIIVVSLSGGATIQQPLGVPMLGYVVGIAFAGVLLDATAVLVVTATSIAIYLAAAGYGGGFRGASLNSMVAAAFGFAVIAVLMAVFSIIQRRNATNARSRALALEIAFTQLREKQALERQTGGAIVDVMSELRSISDQQLSSVHEQVTALTEVTTTVEELSQAALQIAEAAAVVSDNAEQTLAAANRSQEAVNDSQQAMLLIKMQVQQIVERTVALNARIQSIRDVNTAVSTIAAQTHLLALNAAIESAGAGQAGERFATVASEVKKLAQRSQGEVSKIRELVSEVERANTASVMATEQGLKESDKGATRVKAVADANLEVIDSVGTTTVQAKAITLATQQQRTASEQVVDTMRHLRAAAEGVADSASRINGIVTQLSALATQLGTLIQPSSVEMRSNVTMLAPTAPSDISLQPASLALQAHQVRCQA